MERMNVTLVASLEQERHTSLAVVYRYAVAQALSRRPTVISIKFARFRCNPLQIIG